MKKALALLLTTAILAATLTACGSSEGNTNSTDNNANSTANTTEAKSEETGESTEATETNPFKTNDTVSLTFSATTITLIYKGTPEAHFYDYIDTSLEAEMKLYFTYEEESFNNAGVYVLSKDAEGNISTLLQMGDYELKNGELTFGENGFPMTCVFTGTEEEVEGLYSGLDMKGKVKVTDTLLQNNYSIAYVEDIVTKE
jgi:hypothetical protein